MNHLLPVALEAAVPLRIAELADLDDVARRWYIDQWTGPDAIEVLCARADIILYKGGKKGDTASAFNTLAKAVAAMSYTPGGVTVFDRTWCATHAPWGRAAVGIVCVGCLDDPEDAPPNRAARRAAKRRRVVATITTGGQL